MTRSRTSANPAGWEIASGLLAGVVGALTAERALPMPASDPFRGTLAMLPLVLASLFAIHRLATAGGARRLGSAASTGELSALGLLLLLVASRHHLGLERIDEALAAGFGLLLAHRLARQLLALRPLLGRRLVGRPHLVFFLLPLTAYLAILPWSAAHRQPDGDEPFYLLVTHSLAFDGDADLTNNYRQGDWRSFMDRPIEPQPGDPVGAHGELYSRHNAMLPLILAPAYRLGGKTGALATMAMLTAALAWTTLHLARHYDPERPGEALAAYALVAFTPPLLLYSYQVWVEVPAALLLLVALDRILSLRRERIWDWRDWLLIGLPILVLPLVKIRFILLSGPLLALGWWYSRRPRRPILLLTAALGLLAGGMLLYNQLLYQNPLKIHTWQEVTPATYRSVEYLTGFLGLFYDAAFGLFAYAPLWLLLLPALPLLWKRRHPLLVHCAVLTLPYLVIVTPRGEWYGGWSPPFRYALIALPLLGLGLAPLLTFRRRPGARALLAGLGVATLVLTLLWVVLPGWTYSFADGRTLALDALGERLGEGVARFFPSSVRLRAATWIWPPLSFALLTLAWWLPLRRRFRLAAAGVAALLAATALLPLLAARLPTRIVEMEDPEVTKSGGHLHPDRWVIERTKYRGGWVLRVGESLRAKVVPGGRRLRLTLDAEMIRNQPIPFFLDIAAGDRLLGTWQPGRQRIWAPVRLGPVDWPAGAPLVLTARGPHPPGALNGAILDRVSFDWE